MPWVKLDDAVLLHWKFRGISDRALSLWIRGLMHAARYLTDGALPFDFVPNKQQRGAAEDLVRRRLWDKTTAGWQIHGYLDWQESKATIEARRAAQRDRQARWKDRHIDRTPPTTGNGPVSDALLTTHSPIPTVPNLTISVLSTSEGHEEFKKAARDLADKLTMPNAGFVHPERKP